MVRSLLSEAVRGCAMGLLAVQALAAESNVNGHISKVSVEVSK